MSWRASLLGARHGCRCGEVPPIFTPGSSPLPFVGTVVTLRAFNVEFTYLFPSSQAWNVYAGAGPALNIIHRARDTDAEAGFNVLVGVAHEDGLLVELKVGAFDSPRLKFGVGYAFRWR